MCASVGNTLITSPTAITDWAAKHLLAFVWNSGESLRVLLDGETVAQSGVITDVIDNNAQPLRLGVRANGNYPFYGQMADVIIDSRGWSEAEIEALYRRSTFV